MNRSKKAKVIGRLENVDFPDLGIRDLDAKVDTGAYTSSLHCHHIELDPSRESVSFYVLDPSHPEYSDRQFRCPVFDIRNVRSSNGFVEERVLIKTGISIFDKTYTIHLSLTNRAEMRYPVLLGRKFLRNKFVVDVSKKYVGRAK